MSAGQEIRPSFWTRLFRFFIRLIFVFIVGIALGAGVYFGITTLYRQYVQPVQSNIIRLTVVESRLEQVEQLLAYRHDDYTARLDSLEIQVDKNKEQIDEVNTRMAQVEATQAEQIDVQADLSQQVQTMQGGVDKLQSEQLSMNDDLKKLQTESASITDELSDLQSEIRTLNKDIQGVQGELEELMIASDRQRALLNEVELMKAMLLITRSRMFLAQGNVSVAGADISVARDILTDLQSQLEDQNADAVSLIIEQLDTALLNLPRAPVLASDRLEAAWQLLVEGLPLEPLTAETIGSAATPTTILEAPADVTPTPTPTS